ncbi:hypothetical protein CJ030_MR4G025308 [Morella rubra]|uniref:Late embryogenesis abundant protein LEA-2 subgroup domain-containing protein n=1 Tax=Morella rubra TaxID=262757 RepID=A0A6A1VR25_9ROSI|nr:hypothetical protein CJ030_MR4G025308 [Morella rubra]
MAEKVNQQVYQVERATKKPSGDEESATLQSAELRRKKRIKIAMYIAIFAVFQVIVITAFALTVMRVKTPKLRLGTVEFQNLTTGTESFEIGLTTQVRIKNTNFGPYKYDSTTATFAYQGVPVGNVVIPKGKAGLRSTKKVSVTVNLNSNVLPSTSSPGNDLAAGVLTLNSYAKLTGKVELLFVMKKKKSTEMNCTMEINLTAKALQALNCK